MYITILPPQPTRTVGDFDVKEKTRPGVISIIPETRMIDVFEEGRKVNPDAKVQQGILIQASDGRVIGVRAKGSPHLSK